MKDTPSERKANWTRPLSIVHLCAPARVGGLERVVHGLALGQKARGHAVAVVAVIDPSSDTSAFFQPLVEAGVETQQVPIHGRGYLEERSKVREYLRSRRPDILHTHGYRSDILNGFTARRLGIATVSTLHGSSRMGGLSHLFEWLQLKVLRRFDGVIAVSDPLRTELVKTGVRPDRLHLVPNAWASVSEPMPRALAREHLAIGGERPRIGWVGRLIPIKGPDVFVRALAELGSPDWTASIIGDGPEKARIDALLEEESLAGTVRLHGAVPDAGRLFPAFDLLVISSRSEGTPMVLFEAMASGVPIVATAVGGIPDVLGRDAGWLVPPEDPEALADAIDHALGRPEERLERAARAQTLLEGEYGVDRWLDRHDTVYWKARSVAGSR